MTTRRRRITRNSFCFVLGVGLLLNEAIVQETARETLIAAAFLLMGLPFTLHDDEKRRQP